jgi:hypothetical protein
MENDIQLNGPDKTTKPSAGGGVTKDHAVIGIVKDNIDPTKSGIIQVELEGSTNAQSPEKSSGGWVKVRFLSTFFGSVKPTSGTSGTGSYKGNPSAYGQWQAPPDIGSKVLCIFANGDASRGFYIGCIPEPEMLQMVPAIGSSDKITANEGEAKGYGGATRLPVTNINTNDGKTANSAEFNDQPRPVHSYSASVMNQQGIIRDPIRGPISSSASREPSSRVGWGISTPGRPIYEGGYDDTTLPKNLSGGKDQQLKVTARRGGHSIVMDDGDIVGRDQLIRIRTALGHQITMSDDGQTLVILHSNGQSYVELGKEGTVDIFSTNSFNVRTQGDINFHADQHINLHANENLNIQAKNIHVNSDEVSKFRAGKDFKISTLANYTVKAASAAAINAGGEGSLVAGGPAFVVGSKVNLNSGSPGTSPEEVPIITLVAQTDTLYDATAGFMASPGKLMSIASRAPAHMPWANAGQGVSVKSSASASANLPPAPSAGIQEANKAGVATGATAPAIATVASAPASNPVSKSVDNGTTNAVLGSVATSAANGTSAPAVNQGAAIIPAVSNTPATSNALGETVAAPANPAAASSTTSTVLVGVYGQSPTQLVSSGVLKPGADTLISGLASSGTSLLNTMSNSLFTGTPGAENITALAQNMVSQTTSLNTVMQQAQSALTTAGVITGREAPTQIAGIVTAGATVGITDTINAVSSFSTDLVSQSPILGANTPLATVNDPLAGLTGVAGVGGATIPGLSSVAANPLGQVTNTLAAIGAGAAAAGLATSLGGLGGITNALKIMGGLGKDPLGGLLDAVKGVTGAAFDAIKNSFGELQPNVPQYLTQSAKDSAAATAVLSSLVPSNSTASGIFGALGLNSDLEGLVSDISTNLGSALTAGGLSELSNLADQNGFAGAVDNTIAGITGSLDNIAASVGTTNNLISNISGAISKRPLTDTVTLGQISSIIDSTLSPITNVVNAGGSSFGAISSIPGAGSTMSPATNTLGNPGSSGAQLTGLINNISGISGPISSSSVAQTASSVIGQVTGGILGISNSLVRNVNNAVNQISGIAGGIPAFNSGGLSELANAAAAVQSGGAAAVAAQLASGISNLPGGVNSIGSVINNASGASNSIPGASAISGLVSQAQSAMTNGLPNPTTLINSATSKVGGLLSSVTSSLPAGDASQLMSAISSLGGGENAVPVKAPTFGYNTFDRGEIASQTDSLIGDPGIPKPNLVGDSLDSQEKEIQTQINKTLQETTQLEKQIIDANDKASRAKSAYINVVNSLPAGDSKIDQLYQSWLDSLNEVDLLNAKYAALTSSSNETGASAETVNSLNNSSSSTGSFGGGGTIA